MEMESKLKENLNTLKEMVSSIYTADIKLNATDKDYHKYIIIQNEKGVLMINRGLFSISFENEEAVLLSDVEVKNKKHIKDVTI